MNSCVPDNAAVICIIGNVRFFNGFGSILCFISTAVRVTSTHFSRLPSSSKSISIPEQSQSMASLAPITVGVNASSVAGWLSLKANLNSSQSALPFSAAFRCLEMRQYHVSALPSSRNWESPAILLSSLPGIILSYVSTTPSDEAYFLGDPFCFHSLEGEPDFEAAVSMKGVASMRTLVRKSLRSGVMAGFVGDSVFEADISVGGGLVGFPPAGSCLIDMPSRRTRGPSCVLEDMNEFVVLFDVQIYTYTEALKYGVVKEAFNCLFITSQVLIRCKIPRVIN